MKAPICQRLVQRNPLPESARRCARARSLIAPLAMLLIATWVCGCSTFNCDWRRATRSATPAGEVSLEGRWDGQWISDVNHHSGNLRCLVSRASDDRYRARFRATYRRVFHFSYSVPLQVQAHQGGWEFSGEENLGKLAGGVYYYEGRASPTNFVSSYRSKYDHGLFKLHRPE